MIRSLVIGLLVALTCSNLITCSHVRKTEPEAIEYCSKANEELRAQKNIIGLASWAQSSNITDANDQAYIEASQKYDEFSKQQFTEVKEYFDIMPNLAAQYRRQLEKMGIIGTSALSPADSSLFSKVSLNMKKVYSTATITADGKPNQALEPELTEILATSSNEALLREVWTKWRDATGPKMRQDYITYYTLGNKAAKLNELPGKQFKTYDDLWMAEWETPNMKQQVDTLMEETMPIYQKIHAYVRYHLTQKYGTSVMPADGTIPAHLLGNMWAQQWGNILNVIPEMNPHPDVSVIDSKVNAKLQASWSVKDMFQLSEKFFHDLGMKNMTATFWEKSILEKPTDRDLTCHASAWDFFDLSEEDFRIKQCTDRNINDLITVHHEMGHVQYYMNYVVQQPIYRRGANPGFHEAIGDLIALSVATPEHLIKVGLLDAETEDNLAKINLNYQLKMALDKVAFLPFAYVMDKWRWDVFGDASIEPKMNKRWWEYRLKYQGLSPPGRKRTEGDFDPGAKYHIPAGVEYVRYFASHILQFQFYEKMCSFVGDFGDNLYKCDFDGNTDAGTALMKMLAKGSSDTWPTILKDFIGSETMSLSSLNKYFKPLVTFLDKFIADKNIQVGWTANVDDYVEPMAASDYLTTANEQYRIAMNSMTLADWAQGSNISAENEANLVEAVEDFNVFRQKQFAETKEFDYTALAPVQKRQFEKFAVIGTSALNEEDTKTFQNAKLTMEGVFSTALISAGGQSGLALEPNLTQILATSTDAELLKEVWTNFRDATGKKMRQDYVTYFKLGNKAAQANKLPDKDFKTFDDLWMFSWEADDLKQQVDTLMDEVMPLYQKVHAYVRFFLKKQYGAVIPDDGTIPAHLLGNMWAQQWGNILNNIKEMNPYPDVKPIDAEVNEKLQNWNVEDMYKLSEKFFADLGMEKMTAKFWANSILTKPTDRDLTCHASAWDFFDNDGDFRIKQCTEKTINQLTTVHHEMGHIQYFMEYSKQNPVYREGANPGFHEAIGDLITLSVATPGHLAKVGLLDPITDEEVAKKINLNYQMKMALQKIVFLPFSYVMDKWRWDIFGNPNLEQHLNRRWWELRLQFQGLSPPTKRSEADFDPGAKYHIPAGVEYVRYFASHVLQFQFFEKMCTSVPDVTELYQCDFDANTAAGTALITMLQKGSSDTWQNILKDFIGSEKMSLSSMRKYFAPLEVYLDDFITKNNIMVGWNPTITDYFELDETTYLQSANDEFKSETNKMVTAEWAMGSDINDENEANLIAQTELYNKFRQKQYQETLKFNYSDLAPLQKRQFEKFAVIGVSALDEADTKTFQTARLRMEEVFSTATVTVDGKPGLALEPDLTDILATATNESTLRQVWMNFRDVTGAKMRQDYITYYKLGNKAATLNKLQGKEFKTFDDLWMFAWEADDLKQQVDVLMNETMKLYQKVHAYVRYYLKKEYGDEVMPADGTIPAHLLGNMWAQSWSDILNKFKDLNPYPDVKPIDEVVNEKLGSWEIERMYRLSEKFFADLGMNNMTDTFWEKSILEKPTDRNMTCHASAWDFYNPPDFRIKQCTEKTINHLITVHHEMGHIQYFMEYSKQNPIYREGANPGFHEAIGDLIALSVATPGHLAKVGLLDPIADSDAEKINLNYQLKMALEKVVFLPFSYVMDKWRWDVFGDPSLESKLNRHWWELRLLYQGVSPPIADRKRTEGDFDPGAKYHIPAGVEYVRYFASHVLQFQFFEKMCTSVNGITDANLYTCDFDGNTQAGSQLITMLQRGSSDTWQNILKDFIGSEKMSLSSLNKYFAPLETYLDGFIAQNNITVGWNAKVDDYVAAGSSGLTASASVLAASLCTYIFLLFRM